MNGMITEMGIQFDVLPDYLEGAKEAVENAVYTSQKRKNPYALIVKRQTFTNYKLKNKVVNAYPMNREQALTHFVQKIGKHDIVIGTTGFLSRELYELRVKSKQDTSQDFYCVGSMGHASSIGCGVALVK